jgi:hypothetical protein
VRKVPLIYSSGDLALAAAHSQPATPRAPVPELERRLVTEYSAAISDVASAIYDLRSDQNFNSCTHKQRGAGCDVMHVARAFVPKAPSSLSSHDPRRCPHAKKNGYGIDRSNHECHAAETGRRNHALAGNRKITISPNSMTTSRPSE